MASMVGNPTGSVGEPGGRTGGTAAPRGLAGGAQRAAQENMRAKEQAVGTRQREGAKLAKENLSQKERIGGIRQRAVANAARTRAPAHPGYKESTNMKGRHFGPGPRIGSQFENIGSLAKPY